MGTQGQGEQEDMETGPPDRDWGLGGTGQPGEGHTHDWCDVAVIVIKLLPQ